MSTGRKERKLKILKTNHKSEEIVNFNPMFLLILDLHSHVVEIKLEYFSYMFLFLSVACLSGVY